jgi:hypothetical protein
MNGAWRKHRAFRNVDVQILFPSMKEELCCWQSWAGDDQPPGGGPAFDDCSICREKWCGGRNWPVMKFQ